MSDIEAAMAAVESSSCCSGQWRTALGLTRSGGHGGGGGLSEGTREEVCNLGLSSRLVSSCSSRSCCPGGDLRSGTVVVSRVSVGQTEVQLAGLTDTRHQLLLLTLGLVAPVGEDLLLGPDLTVVLDVFGDCQVRDGSSGHRDGLTAQRTDGNLDILLVGAATIV